MDTEVATDGEALARRLGAHPGSLATLLRYLAMLGVVTREGEAAFRLTGLGALLRADTPGSLRPSPCCTADRSTAPSPASPTPCGRGDRLRPPLRREPLRPLRPRPRARRAVRPVDGRELAHVRAAPRTPSSRPRAGHRPRDRRRRRRRQRRTARPRPRRAPRLHGVLLERPHVVEAARRRLDAAGYGGRCSYRVGDFADVPAGGDVYLLSRVLHDWDDERCREILRHCARAMPAHADLLVVERILPADGSASLATAWDLHMMCNVGGRERREDHYARLLADAGLTLVDRSPLPLDASVLHARKAVALRPVPRPAP
ncbi:methyltransferase [Kitasatospora aburaviensis]